MMKVLELALSWPLASLSAMFLLYIVLVFSYRLRLHPLARFPGPALAAVTFWYQFYYDFFGDGKYVYVIRDMHTKYGPIVRISPDELHVNDPAFVSELMPTTGRRRHKYYRQMRLFGFTEAAGTTADHEMHRMRRRAMTKKFSKESVRRLEPIMTENLEKLFNRLERFGESGEPLDLLPMFGAFTNDLIFQYAYGEHSNWLEAPSFNRSFFKMVSVS